MMSPDSKSFLLKLTVAAVLLALALVSFWSPLRSLVLAREFPAGVLKKYEDLFDGEGLEEPGNDPPPRTGKVILVKPSTHSVYAGGAGVDTLSWTQIEPSRRPKIARQIDPPSIHDSWYNLDASLRASTPEEVDTVVFCEPRSAKVGFYVKKDKPNEFTPNGAYRREYVLKAYDRRSGDYLGSCGVKGEAPPMETTAWGPHAGEAPSLEEAVGHMPLRR